MRGRRPFPHPLQPTGRWGPFLSRPPCPVYKADGDNPFPGAAAAVAHPPPAPIITSLADRPRGLPGAHQGAAGLGTSREAGPGRQPHTAALTVLRPGGPGCTASTPVGLQPLRPLPLCFPLGRNTGAGSHSLLQGVFPTQGSNPGLLHCRRILCQLSLQGSPHFPSST